MSATVLKAFALSLRDLCEQGASQASVTVAGVLVAYSPAAGCRVVVPGQPPVVLTDADLDEIGLLPEDNPVPESLRELVARGDLDVDDDSAPLTKTHAPEEGR